MPIHLLLPQSFVKSVGIQNEKLNISKQLHQPQAVLFQQGLISFIGQTFQKSNQIGLLLPR